MLSEILETLKSIDKRFSPLDVRLASWKFWRRTEWYTKYGKWFFAFIWWLGVLVLMIIVHERRVQYRGDKAHTATYAHWLHTVTMVGFVWGLFGRVFDVVTDEVVFFWMVYLVETVQVVVELAFELGA